MSRWSQETAVSLPTRHRDSGLLRTISFMWWGDMFPVSAQKEERQPPLSLVALDGEDGSFH